MLKSVLKFGLVGGLATLVHITVGILWIRFGLNPLVANFLAYITALIVSFWGHHSFTFNNHNLPLGKTAPRFLTTSALGFLLNELILASLVGLNLMSPSSALALATLLVAGFTYLLSRRWVFNGPSH
ncbi:MULTISPECIES: GtrA family protein [Falsihalocynthiibacter]|uniref:GtrA family protein n=1 Tax=Falsihalocynthiibacter TaxID=2854182 RepID=UPI0030030DBE